MSENKEGTAAAPTAIASEEGLPNATAFDQIITEYPEVDDTDFHKEVFLDDNNGWTTEVEDYVRSVSSQCARYSVLHSETSKIFARRDQWITNLLILLPFLITIISLFPLPATLTKIVTGILGTIGGILAALNKLNRFGQKSIIQKASGRKYMELNSTIVEQIILDVKKRYNGIKFMRWSRRTFYYIRSLAPFPSNRSFSRFNKQKEKDAIDPLASPPPVIPPGTVVVPIPPEQPGDIPLEGIPTVPTEPGGVPGGIVPPPISQSDYNRYLEQRRLRAQSQFKPDVE